jgi:hypothetical protein
MSPNLDSGGGGDDGPSWREYVLVRGQSFTVRWGKLFSAVVMGTVIAFFQAIVGFLESLGLAVRATSRAVTQPTTELIETAFAATDIMDDATAAATAEIASAGILAFALAAVVAGAVTYIYSWGVNAVVE